MSKVVSTASIIIAFSYIMIGYFGNATFITYEEEELIFGIQNILRAPYQENVWIISA